MDPPQPLDGSVFEPRGRRAVRSPTHRATRLRCRGSACGVALALTSRLLSANPVLDALRDETKSAADVDVRESLPGKQVVGVAFAHREKLTEALDIPERSHELT
jgi:hypothetical protein